MQAVHTGLPKTETGNQSSAGSFQIVPALGWLVTDKSRTALESLRYGGLHACRVLYWLCGEAVASLPGGDGEQSGSASYDCADLRVQHGFQTRDGGESGPLF